jgi:COMPASS component SWD2
MNFANLSIGAVIKGDGQATNIDFHRNGQYFVMGTSNSTVYLIDSLSGQQRNKLFTKSAGLGQVIYTHHGHCVLCSSTTDRSSNDIRYYCLYDNKYLRHFRGHSDLVKSIAMSPVDDHFLSSSVDRTICMWSLNTGHPVAKLSLPSDSECPRSHWGCFRSHGKSMSSGQHSVKLYDARNYQKGPFVNIASTDQAVENALARADADMPLPQVHRALASSWHDFCFSPDGAKVLVNTSADLLLSLDGFRPDVEPVVLCGRKNSSGLSLGASFSPDSKCVYVGTEDKEVLVYDHNSGQLTGVLKGEHVAPVTAVKCNPRYNMLVSAGVNAALWI